MNPINPNSGQMRCADCEAILMDVLDNSLPAELRAAFDQHISGCNACRQMLAEAQQGAAWLELLRSPRPQPADDLIARIIAQTSGAVPVELPALQPAFAGIYELPFRQRFVLQLRGLGNVMLQPRMAMTAAMAFFSIVLTMNLAGVRVRDINLSNLRPSRLQRSIYQANARVIQFYDNLGVVNDLESHVQDAEQMNNAPNTNDSRPGGPQAPANQPQPAPPSKGTSRKETPTELPSQRRQNRPEGARV